MVKKTPLDHLRVALGQKNFPILDPQGTKAARVPLHTISYHESTGISNSRRRGKRPCPCNPEDAALAAKNRRPGRRSNRASRKPFPGRLPGNPRAKASLLPLPEFGTSVSLRVHFELENGGHRVQSRELGSHGLVINGAAIAYRATLLELADACALPGGHPSI